MDIQHVKNRISAYEGLLGENPEDPSNEESIESSFIDLFRELTSDLNANVVHDSITGLENFAETRIMPPEREREPIIREPAPEYPQKPQINEVVDVDGDVQNDKIDRNALNDTVDIRNSTDSKGKESVIAADDEVVSDKTSSYAPQDAPHTKSQDEMKLVKSNKDIFLQSRNVSEIPEDSTATTELRVNEQQPLRVTTQDSTIAKHSKTSSSELPPTNVLVDEPLPTTVTSEVIKNISKVTAEPAASLQSNPITTQSLNLQLLPIGGSNTGGGMTGNSAGGDSNFLQQTLIKQLGVAHDRSSRSTLNHSNEKLIAHLRKTPTQTQTKVIEHIKQVLESAARNRDNNTIVLRLDPPELGQLTVKLVHRADEIFARLTPENAEVEAMLRSRVSEINSILSATGIKADNIHVTIGNDGQSMGEKQFERFLQHHNGRSGENNSSTSNSSQDESSLKARELVNNNSSVESATWVA